jgi:hypothetical protein
MASRYGRNFRSRGWHYLGDLIYSAERDVGKIVQKLYGDDGNDARTDGEVEDYNRLHPDLAVPLEARTTYSIDSRSKSHRCSTPGFLVRCSVWLVLFGPIPPRVKAVPVIP